MNLLRECTFFDRDRNAQIELDDLVEEVSKFSSPPPQSSTAVTDKQQPSTCKMYLILYFTADWLPEASNAQLNDKLRAFMQSTPPHHRCCELVFVSSDKTSDSYWSFLRKYKFVRYSLDFHEKELKTQLCNYFNVNGIPFMTLIEFTLDANLKIVNFRCDKRNNKHDFLGDPTGSKFPWFRTSPHQQHQQQQQQEQSMSQTIPFNKSTIQNINEIFNIVDVDEEEVNNEGNIMDLEDVKQCDGEQQHEDSDISSDGSEVVNPVLRDIFENLEATNKMCSPHDYDAVVGDASFIFLLFGSPQLRANATIVQSIVEFWKRFHKKHKFFVIYIEFNSTADDLSRTKLSVDLTNVNWFTISKLDIKISLCKHYGVNSVPKLLVVDRETGDLLNNSLKTCLIEYVHEFFNSIQQQQQQQQQQPQQNKPPQKQPSQEVDKKPTPAVMTKESSCQNKAKPAEQQSILISDDKPINPQVMWRNFNLNFDFDYDIFDAFRSKRHHRHRRRPHHHHHHHCHENSCRHRSATSTTAATTTTASSSQQRSKSRSHKRKLNRWLIDQLKDDLVKIGGGGGGCDSGGEAAAAAKHPPATAKDFYLLYFCSFFTASNSRQRALFEQIMEFLKYVQEKIECSIRIVLVSSDFLESDYEKLVDKYRNMTSTTSDQEPSLNFDRYALKFRSKLVKEKLFQKLHVTGIPWFSLIDANSGEILCENLKIFILNSQLREMIF